VWPWVQPPVWQEKQKILFTLIVMFLLCFWCSFELIQLEFCRASWMHRFMSSRKFRKFSTTINSSILSAFVKLTFLSSIPILHMLVWWYVLKTVNLFHYFFLLLRLNNFNCPTFMFIYSSSCFNLLLSPPVNFSFQLLYF
jgi:hypothetical protein